MPDFGVSGYLTPDTLPIERHCRTFRIPNSTQWLAVFMGALLPLIYPESWQFYGELSPDEAADAALDVIWDAYAQDDGLCPALIPAPFWDTASDVGAELPADEQIWYGKAGSFAEDLQLWILQGAIVLTFGLAGIKPAIRFATVYRKFLLEYKNDHVGSIIRFFVDGLQIFTAVDSGDGSISRVKVAGSPDLDSHEIQIQADEGNGLSIIRKELSPAEVSDPNLRYDPTCSCVQRTTDNGATWHDAPAADPRTSPTYLFPARGGDDPRCDAAANMTAHLKALVDRAITETTQLQFVNAWMALIALFLPEIWIVLEVVETVVQALLTIGMDVIEGAFTDEQWSLIQQICYCDISDDGTVTQAQYEHILFDIHEQCSAIVYDVMFYLLPTLGYVGLSNAGASGDVVGTCSACDWTYKWDFGVSNGGWESQGFDDPAWNSEYSAGCCWRTASGSFATTKQIPACHILSVTINANASMAVATAATEHGTTFTHRCDGGACASIDWSISNSWLSVFQVGGHELYSVTLHGDGSRPTFTGGSFI